LQPPFFDLAADIAANYGGIGAVIGHEIGHGFDDQGSKYDGDGNMVDWWSDEDRSKFEELTAVLVKQFDALSPASTPDIHVNGAFTLGENIGDLGGLAIAYKAWKLALQGEESPVIDGLTGEQRFFLSYAHSWRNKNRPEEVRRRIATDPHSPDEFRCNQIVRLDRFRRLSNQKLEKKQLAHSLETVKLKLTKHQPRYDDQILYGVNKQSCCMKCLPPFQGVSMTDGGR
jgi:putative endopeptidase